jgi:hypothetical protein
MSKARARAPGRWKTGAASRPTRLTFVPSMPAQAGTEPRHLLPPADRLRYAADAGPS